MYKYKPTNISHTYNINILHLPTDSNIQILDFNTIKSNEVKIDICKEAYIQFIVVLYC